MAKQLRDIENTMVLPYKRYTETGFSIFEECDICGDPATYNVDGFGDCCRSCKNEVVADLNIDEEDGVTRL